MEKILKLLQSGDKADLEIALEIIKSNEEEFLKLFNNQERININRPLVDEYNYIVCKLSGGKVLIIGFSTLWIKNIPVSFPKKTTYKFV